VSLLSVNGLGAIPLMLGGPGNIHVGGGSIELSDQSDITQTGQMTPAFVEMLMFASRISCTDTEVHMSWLKRSQHTANPAGSHRADARGRATGPQGNESAMPPRKSWGLFALILLINYLLVRLLFPSPDAPVTVPYTVFKQEVAKGNVTMIYSKGNNVEGKFAAPVTWPPAEHRETVPSSLFPVAKPRAVQIFATTLPEFVGPDFEKFLTDHKVEISAVPMQNGSGWATLLYGFGPALLIIAFYVWLYRRAAQGERDTATRLLTQYRRQLDALVAALLARDTLDEKEILEVTGLPASAALPDRPQRSDGEVKLR
jgi:hypothetical protein